MPGDPPPMAYAISDADEPGSPMLTFDPEICQSPNTHTWTGEVEKALLFYDRRSAEQYIKAFLSRHTTISVRPVRV